MKHSLLREDGEWQMHVADLDIFPSIEHCWILDCYMTGLTLDCILFTDANGIFIGVLMSCI